MSTVKEKLKGRQRRSNKDERSYRERNGTTRVGDALRWLKNTGGDIAPSLLDLAGTVTGIEGLNILGDKIRSDGGLTAEQKSLLLKELEYDMIEAQEVTKRWQADMMSDSWLSKNVRPLVLCFLTIAMSTYIILDSSNDGFDIKNEWIELLASLMLLVYGGYFGARTAEKIFGKKK